MTIEVVRPVPMREAPKPRSRAQREPIPPGAVLGLISNGKERAWELLDNLGNVLVDSGLFASHFIWQKATPAFTVTESERSRLLARAHFIVTGVGD